MRGAPIGVVVLSWNAPAHAAAAVRSALEQEGLDLFVVLVDNASKPADVETLRAEFMQDHRVELLRLDQNLGYAGGNNTGVGRALERGAELVLVLTQDARLKPGALAALVDVAVRHDAGLVGPRLMQLRDESVELSCGERLSVPLLCMPRRLLRFRRRSQEPYRVGGLMGCVLLISRRCWEDLDGFDLSFFAYYEEVDFCLRARRRGWSIWCVPSAIALHDGMRGFASGFTPLSAELKARNLLWTIRRHARPLDWLVLLPTWVGLTLTSLALYGLRRRGDIVTAILRGTARGCSTAPPLLGEDG